MARMKVEFEGFDEVLARLKKLDADTKTITEKALKETHKVVTKKAEEAIKKHHRTGDTEKSLRKQAKIFWTGGVAEVKVGFDIENGGLPSIFLMYGTPKHAPNHPGTDEDKNLYNAFFGSKTKKEITALQEEIFFEELRRLGG